MGIFFPERRRAKRVSAADHAENAPRADQNGFVMGIFFPERRRTKCISAADRAENALRPDQKISAAAAAKLYEHQHPGAAVTAIVLDRSCNRNRTADSLV